MRTVIALVLLITCAAIGQSTSDPKVMYERAMNQLSGTSQSRDAIAAIDLFQRSADLGYAPSAIAIGYIYETGFHLAPNPQRAATAYRRAAEQGDPLAQWLLGRLYLLNQVPGDSSDIERWLKQSAAAGNPFGALLYGSFLQDRNPESSVTWFRQAAEQGLPFAQFHYGQALLKGRGVSVDRQQSYVWLLLAQQGGVQDAQSDLSLLEGLLGSQAVEKAKGEARDLRDRVTRSVSAHGCTGWNGELDKIPAPPPLDIQHLCR